MVLSLDPKGCKIYKTLAQRIITNIFKSKQLLEFCRWSWWKYFTVQPVQVEFLWIVQEQVEHSSLRDTARGKQAVLGLPLWIADLSRLLPGRPPGTEYNWANTVSVWQISAHTLDITSCCLSSPSRDRWRFLKQPEGSRPVASQSTQHRREGDQWQQNHLQRPGGVLQGQNKGACWYATHRPTLYSLLNIYFDMLYLSFCTRLWLNPTYLYYWRI